MPRKDILEGKTQRIKTGCGWLYVTLNYQDGKPFETFVSMGKSGGCANSQAQALGLLASLCLRNGIEPGLLIRQLKGISCHIPVNGTLSCADGFAKLIEKIMNIQSPVGISVEDECPAGESWGKVYHPPYSGVVNREIVSYSPAFHYDYIQGDKCPAAIK
ncbi:MAG: TSCPD domain-containing protein [Endomicrobiia bacterium]|nr:TSCPD domain-containing protein [Endomicrobiia bacterium]